MPCCTCAISVSCSRVFFARERGDLTLAMLDESVSFLDGKRDVVVLEEILDPRYDCRLSPFLSLHFDRPLSIDILL